MDLKFDKMGVDTSLAQDYLDTMLKSGEEFSFGEVKYEFEDIRENLKQFGIKLRESKNLIVQLEYLLRDIPVLDTITQLDLIIQQTNYVSSNATREAFDVTLLPFTIKMANDTPLFLLGNIAKTVLHQKLDNNYCVWLEHEDKSKAICHLFTKLCHDAKLPVSLTNKNKGNSQTLSINNNKGTLGVVSEFSDVDSAVDILLASSIHVPWKLQRIFVQESVYQQFQNALIWKCNLNKQEKSKSTISSSDTLEYNGRLFILDMLGTTELKPGTVVIEAYRTRKELKIMLNQYRPHYLSLWASDIAEINEIAHSVSAHIVWVNNFGDFRGPPKVTEALFHYKNDSIVMNVRELPELRESWLKLNCEARREILCNALDACATADTADKKIVYQIIKKDLQKVDINAPSAFIDVGKDYVCLGINTPSTKIFNRKSDFLTTAFFTSVLKGNAYVLSCKSNSQIADIFRKAGIPIIFSEECDDSTKGSVVYNYDYDNDEVTQSIKVIWTNSGTIFAN